MKLREVAHFLSRLDSDDCREANGRTIFENSMITVSTESGDGRHNNSKRELSGVFHAISPAAGRFKTDRILDVNAEGIDVYNTMLAAWHSPPSAVRKWFAAQPRAVSATGSLPICHDALEFTEMRIMRLFMGFNEHIFMFRKHVPVESRARRWTRR